MATYPDVEIVIPAGVQNELLSKNLQAEHLNLFEAINKFRKIGKEPILLKPFYNPQRVCELWISNGRNKGRVYKLGRKKDWERTAYKDFEWHDNYPHKKRPRGNKLSKADIEIVQLAVFLTGMGKYLKSVAICTNDEKHLINNYCMDAARRQGLFVGKPEDVLKRKLYPWSMIAN